MKQTLPLITIILILSSCNKNLIPYPTFDTSKIPASPDYSNQAHWAALPIKNDMADLVPGKEGILKNKQEAAQVDVFFLHPTIYTDKQQSVNPWNADLKDEKINNKTDDTTIKYQATVFNGSAKVYAPRYRQAHINVFYPEKSTPELSKAALDLAYSDVKKAFKYYLNNYNNGRPIIIGSHSQGTTHAIRLIKEFFDGKPLQEKLVAAYIIGMPVKADVFNSIDVCDSSNQTNCWVGWNTYAKDYYPPTFKSSYDNVLNVNPLNWKIDDIYAGFDMNKGGILKNYKKILPELSDAQNKDGMLWINKPHFFGNFLINWKRYHIVDYNLFYMNIRENVAQRVEAHLSK